MLVACRLSVGQQLTISRPTVGGCELFFTITQNLAIDQKKETDQALTTNAVKAKID